MVCSSINYQIVQPVHIRRTVCALLFAVLWSGCDSTDIPEEVHVPESWARDAVFYQIFPERFRNGDPENDPTFASIEAGAPESWAISSWTGEWYKRAAWEEEMGDNFYDSVFHRRFGGDLQGVMDQLDYLEDLGITALYLNPIFYARSLHKYDATSMHHVDPYFGPDPPGDIQIIAEENPIDPESWSWTAADSLFLEVVKQAHSRQIRVIIDGVFNHTGQDFFAFQDIKWRGPDSPFADWYKVTSWDNPGTPQNEFDHEGWWGHKPLPVFADNEDGTDLPLALREYVFAITERWMRPNGIVADGVDGWRLDVASEVPVQFWRAWNEYVRELNADSYTVAEIWEESSAFITDASFSATMNYHGFAFPVKGFMIDGTISPSDFNRVLRQRREAFSTTQSYQVLNLIDSHDTDRLASMIVNAGRQEYADPERFDYDREDRVSPRYSPDYSLRKPTSAERAMQRLVALFQMTYIGAPMIYYGTESGMWGADDPDNRMPMVWPDQAYDAQVEDPRPRSREADAVAFDSTMFSYYRDVVRLRKDHLALRRGDIQAIDTDACVDVYAFQRTHESDMLTIVLNRGSDECSLKLPGVKLDRVAFATDDQGWSISTSDSLRIAPLTGLVFR